MKKILVIEDDIQAQKRIQEIFSLSKDYEVSVAGNGHEGLILVTRLQPDLLILDVMLPEIDGFEICKRIQALPQQKRPRVVLLTALTSLLNNMEADWLARTGAEGLLTKPINAGEMMGMIHKILS